MILKDNSCRKEQDKEIGRWAKKKVRNLGQESPGKTKQ